MVWKILHLIDALLAKQLESLLVWPVHHDSNQKQKNQTFLNRLLKPNNIFLDAAHLIYGYAVVTLATVALKKKQYKIETIKNL